MKRGREEGSLGASKRQKREKSPEVVFLVTAGAGGKLPGEGLEDGVVVNERTSLRAMLLRSWPGAAVVGPVRSDNGKRLVGGGGPTYKVVCAHRKALAKVAKDLPLANIILVGQSFGSRVSCYSVASRFAKREKDLSSVDISLNAPPKKDKRIKCEALPANIRGLLLFGYPAFHKVQNRTQIVETMALENTVNALFVSGSKDSENVAALRECIESISNARIQFYQADKGEHCPLSGTSELEIESLENAIQIFVKKALTPER